jgi:hypothetical protein
MIRKLKYWNIFIIAIAVMLAWLVTPKSCKKFGNTELLERKSERSLIIDSILSAQNEKFQAKSDSIVNRFKDSIFKIEKERTALATNYYALRKVLRQYQTIRIDSLGQTVNVPVIVYNDAINSGNMCDSLIMYMDAELNLKDSIISTRELQLQSVNDLNKTHQVTIKDTEVLIAELRKDLKKARKANDVLKVVAILALLANLVH